MITDNPVNMKVPVGGDRRVRVLFKLYFQLKNAALKLGIESVSPMFTE